MTTEGAVDFTTQVIGVGVGAVQPRDADKTNLKEGFENARRRFATVAGNPAPASVGDVVFRSAVCGVVVQGPVEIVGKGRVGAEEQAYVETVWEERGSHFEKEKV